MNILNLLTKEKRVAGIEISDSVVRIAFFRAREKKKGDVMNEKDTHDELVLIEEPIGANIIADGIVLDIDLLGKTLKNIWEKADLDTDYAIVAIPDDKIYSRVFSFPKSIDGIRLTEAMRLAISFQLPMKTEDVYLDWERTAGTAKQNEILLSTIPKEVAKQYITALEFAGIKTLALESHLASIARAVKLDPKEITIFSKKTPDGATIFALENGILRFSRTLPIRFVDEDKISAETERVKTALHVDTKKSVRTEEIINARICDEYAGRTEFTSPQSKWLVALGTAMRGKLSDGTDNLISLLPVGTEEAYAYQKTTIFITLLRNLTIGVSVFFVVAYLSAYLFILSLSQDANRNLTTLTATPTNPALLEKESVITRVNALTSTAGAILAETPLWSTVLTEIGSRVTDGITISSLSAPTINDRISLTGVAHDRVTLNQFKKSLQESSLLSEVGLPITNLEQKENIPFSTSFRIANPSTVYYK